MKKYLKLIFISILVFSVCGCSNKDLLSQTEEMSNVIIKLYQDIYYDYSKLPKESIKIINDLKDYEESNEKSINLLNPESYTEEKDSDGVFLKDNEYHVYYNKLDFINEDESGRKYAIVNANSEVAIIYKDEWPILYKDTKDNEITDIFIPDDDLERLVVHMNLMYSSGEFERSKTYNLKK